MHTFARDNITILGQGIELLQRISDEHYRDVMPPIFTSGVGTHMRHILDHFDCLLRGLASGSVDYDERQRDGEVERDKRLALTRLHSTIGRLQEIADGTGDQPLRVKLDGGGHGDDKIWSQSSLTRELQFLTSHTIHHYALVAAILANAGCELTPGFGVSPSTLAYEKQQVAQAR